VDARAARFVVSAEDIRIFSRLLSTLHARHGRGLVAFVSWDGSWPADASRVLGAGPNARFATFTSMESADAWLAHGAELLRKRRLIRYAPTFP